MLFCPSTAHPSARDTPFPLRAVAACPRTYGCPLHPNSHGQGPFPYYIPLFPSLPPERPSGTPLHTQPRIAPGKVSKTHLQTERCSPRCSVGNEAAQKCGENGLGGRQELGLIPLQLPHRPYPCSKPHFWCSCWEHLDRTRLDKLTNSKEEWAGEHGRAQARAWRQHGQHTGPEYQFFCQGCNHLVPQPTHVCEAAGPGARG